MKIDLDAASLEFVQAEQAKQEEIKPFVLWESKSFFENILNAIRAYSFPIVIDPDSNLIALNFRVRFWIPPLLGSYPPEHGLYDVANQNWSNLTRSRHRLNLPLGIKKRLEKIANGLEASSLIYSWDGEAKLEFSLHFHEKRIKFTSSSEILLQVAKLWL